MPLQQATTVRALIDAGTLRLQQSPSARIDTELLLAMALDMNRAGLYARPEAAVQGPALQRFEELLERRGRGVPVAYLQGRREFRSLEFAVDEHTLIPRPETELLVERALECILEDAVLEIADLGTGSGCIAISIAVERPACKLLATDISDRALAMARRNAARLGAANLEFATGDWYGPLAEEAYDLIVANPPYVGSEDPLLTSSDIRHEPATALAAGRDGLDALREIAAGAPLALRPGGIILVEHGAGQGDAVRRLFSRAGLASVRSWRDLAGHERITGGVREL